ncbi:hypothetical protein [Streptomyces sp. NPDC054837]
MSGAADERDRILTGRPERSNGALTIVALAIEAGVPRNALTQRHPDLKNEFYAKVKERGQPTDAETRLRKQVVRLAGGGDDQHLAEGEQDDVPGGGQQPRHPCPDPADPGRHVAARVRLTGRGSAPSIGFSLLPLPQLRVRVLDRDARRALPREWEGPLSGPTRCAARPAASAVAAAAG